MLDDIQAKGDALRFKRIEQLPDPRRCFVIMPLKKQFDEVYQDIIKPAVLGLGIQPVRADEIYSRNAIIDDIWIHIQRSAWLIADLTDRNPNVFYELGLAHAIGRSPLLLAQNIEDVPFDLRHWRCIVYDQTIRGGKRLAEAIKKTITEDKYFVQIPFEMFADKFFGGFQVKQCSCKVSFQGRRGEESIFRESWNIVMLHDGMSYLYRKIRTDGSIGEIVSDAAQVKQNKIMEGVFLITLEFGRSLKRGDVLEYDLTYRIENGFKEQNEFWNFDVETDTGEFVYEYDFSNTTDVSNLRASKTAVVKSTAEVKIPVKRKAKRFFVSEANLKIGQTVLVRWSWND